MINHNKRFSPLPYFTQVKEFLTHPVLLSVVTDCWEGDGSVGRGLRVSHCMKLSHVSFLR